MHGPAPTCPALLNFPLLQLIFLASLGRFRAARLPGPQPGRCCKFSHMSEHALPPPPPPSHPPNCLQATSTQANEITIRFENGAAVLSLGNSSFAAAPKSAATKVGARAPPLACASVPAPCRASAPAAASGAGPSPRKPTATALLKPFCINCAAQAQCPATPHQDKPTNPPRPR